VIPYDRKPLVRLPIRVDVWPLDRAEHMGPLDETLVEPAAITLVHARRDRPSVVHGTREKANLSPQRAARAPRVHGDGGREHHLGDPEGLVNSGRWRDGHPLA
jgi:hypothetical protein